MYAPPRRTTRVFELLRARKISLREAARRTGYTHGALVQVKSGQSAITLRFMETFGALFPEYSADYLFPRVDEPEQVAV